MKTYQVPDFMLNFGDEKVKKILSLYSLYLSKEKRFVKNHGL